MKDAVLKGELLNGLNEIKKVAIQITEGNDCLDDEIYDALGYIVMEADILQQEIQR